MTQNKVTIVDDDDFEWLSKWKWFYKSEYAVRNSDYDSEKRRTILRMHREIMSPPSGYVVDHINGDTLDNRKENLRICLQSENMKNRQKRKGGVSSYKGVVIKSGAYEVRITVNGKRKYLGRYTDEIAAANCYNHFAKIYHGEYANLNNVEEIDNWGQFRSQKGKTTKYNGVFWDKSRNRWIAKVGKDGKRVRVGSFINEEDAYIAIKENLKKID